jgi:PPK2 family polyphosphate:nucleotide phosphotransferase
LGAKVTNFLKQFLVEPGSKVKLRDIDPGFHGEYASREAAAPDFEAQLKKLDVLQYSMYAERRHSLLVVFQAMDAGGKDGVIRHVITGMNPSGVRVVSFKQPTPVELSHDFLWRVHAQAPSKGEVVVFNRSHYEDVLVVRVHKLVPKEVWSERYELINEFERLLAEQNNTTILKFFLYISKEEQLKRFKQRLEDPTKQWKISESDYSEREHWDDYLDAFDDAVEKTSKPYAPWYVIPANKKWFRDLAVARVITETLEGLNMQMPAPTVDLEAIRKRYHEAVADMRNQK